MPGIDHPKTSIAHSSNWGDPIQRIALIGILANSTLAVLKLASGRLLHSKSLEADGWHSIGDLSADFVALAMRYTTVCMKTRGSKSWLSENMEGMASVIMSVISLLGGLTLWWASVTHLFGSLIHTPMLKMDISHHDHDYQASTPSSQAIWPPLLTVFVKEWLYKATMKLAQQKSSTLLASKAAHDRADGLSSAVTVVAILGANVLGHAGLIDSAGSFVISLMVIRTAYENMFKAARELLGKP